MSKRFILISTGLMLLIAIGANGQGLSLGPQLGYQKASDADNGKFMGGVALRMKLSSALGVEGSVGYRSETYANGGVTINSWPVMVTGLLYPIPILYGAMGIGWYNSSITYNPSIFHLQPDQTQQVFGWHFGGGLELPAGATSRITADVRYVFLNYDFSAIPGSSSIKSDFYVITVGYLFDL